MTVIGSAAQRRKNSQALSVGGPESGPLLFHSNNVSGTNTAAPSTKPSRHAFMPVIGRHKESINNEGRNRNIVVPYETTQLGTNRIRNGNSTEPFVCNKLSITAENINGTNKGARTRAVQLNFIACAPRNVR